MAISERPAFWVSGETAVIFSSRVRVVRGLSGRDKTVFVDGVGAERVREVLRSRQR